MRLPENRSQEGITRRQLLTLDLHELGAKSDMPSKGKNSASIGSPCKLELDSSLCTACGICVQHCSDEALRWSEHEGEYELLFWQKYCTGCGECVSVCPEKCLRLERISSIERSGGVPVSLYHVEMARCKECNAPVVPQAMLAGIERKLGGFEKVSSYLDLCPACRIRADSHFIRRQD